MGKIITFGTLKGGVGKTMLCFNIGGILSQLGYRVLVIDSDLQGNLTNNMASTAPSPTCSPPTTSTTSRRRSPSRTSSSSKAPSTACRCST